MGVVNQIWNWWVVFGVYMELLQNNVFEVYIKMLNDPSFAGFVFKHLTTLTGF